MDEFDDLATYNGDTEHDMWVDFTTHEYTGELGDIFEDSDLDIRAEWDSYLQM